MHLFIGRQLQSACIRARYLGSLRTGHAFTPRVEVYLIQAQQEETLHAGRALGRTVRLIPMKACFLLSPALFVCAAPVLAQVVVASPHETARVASPFWLSAKAEPCSSQAVAAMGYSIDNSSSTTIVSDTSVSATVPASVGQHVLHVKSWGIFGAPCVTDVSITVVPSPEQSVPANAKVSKEIQVWTGWHAVNDTGTGNGMSHGIMSLARTPALSGVARKFKTTYSNSAGHRYYINFAYEWAPKNFLYDAWVYIANPSTDIANLEMDMNEVIWNGDTIIYGVQCDGYTNTWDYTTNAGSRKHYSDVWLHSRAYCNPREWSTNAWHHVQMTYSRDSAGNVTYKSVWLDGVEQIINETVPSAFSLGWGKCLLTNFQVDGLGGYGWATVYLDHLTVYRW